MKKKRSRALQYRLHLADNAEIVNKNQIQLFKSETKILVSAD